MKRERLADLAMEHRKAENLLEAAVKQSWPEGSFISFTLQHRQKNPSYGEVLCHDGHGHVRVRIDSARTATNRPVWKRHVRDVHFSKILTEPR